MKKRYRLKKSVKKGLVKIALSLLLAYLVIGTCCLAIDSHINPERHEQAVREGMLFSWE